MMHSNPYFFIRGKTFCLGFWFEEWGSKSNNVSDFWNYRYRLHS